MTLCIAKMLLAQLTKRRRLGLRQHGELTSSEGCQLAILSGLFDCSLGGLGLLPPSFSR